MFVSRPDVLKYNPELVEIWVNDIAREGSIENRQCLRKYTDGSWKLDVMISFNKFNIPLQEQQARELIAGKLGNTYDCQIITHQD